MVLSSGRVGLEAPEPEVFGMESGAVSRLRAFVVDDPIDSSNQTKAALAARLLLCLQLADDGLVIKRQALCRQYPLFDEKQIEDELREWLANGSPTGWAEGWTVSNPSRFRV